MYKLSVHAMEILKFSFYYFVLLSENSWGVYEMGNETVFLTEQPA